MVLVTPLSALSSLANRHSPLMYLSSRCFSHLARYAWSSHGVASLSSIATAFSADGGVVGSNSGERGGTGGGAMTGERGGTGGGDGDKAVVRAHAPVPMVVVAAAAVGALGAVLGMRVVATGAAHLGGVVVAAAARVRVPPLDEYRPMARRLMIASRRCCSLSASSWLIWADRVLLRINKKNERGGEERSEKGVRTLARS